MISCDIFQAYDVIQNNQQDLNEPESTLSVNIHVTFYKGINMSQ